MMLRLSSGSLTALSAFRIASEPGTAPLGVGMGEDMSTNISCWRPVSSEPPAPADRRGEPGEWRRQTGRRAHHAAGAWNYRPEDRRCDWSGTPGTGLSRDRSRA